MCDDDEHDDDDDDDDVSECMMMMMVMSDVIDMGVLLANRMLTITTIVHDVNTIKSRSVSISSICISIYVSI